jgi:glycerol kinase
VWKDASAFIATRRFQRFEPGAGVASATDARAGWARAVRAALAWARDRGT